MGRRDFFQSMEQPVTFKQIIGKDTANAQTVFLDVARALVSKSSASLPPSAESLPEGTIRVFLKSVPANLMVGDQLALANTRTLKEFNYSIVDIDTNVRGLNARRFPVRIEAKRRAA